MKWMILTPKQIIKFRKYKITPWWGIDPIQTKDGRWVLRLDQISELEEFKIKLKKESEKDKITFAIEEFKKIKSKDIVELTKEDFPEEEIIDNKIKK